MNSTSPLPPPPPANPQTPPPPARFNCATLHNYAPAPLSPAAVALAREAIAAHLRVPEPLNPDEWADRHAWIAAPGGGPAIKYTTAAAPHQRDMHRAALDQSAEAVVYLGAAQVMGKTQVMLNLIGYFAHHQVRKQLIMYPTIDSSKKFAKNKLEKFIAATACLRALATREGARRVRGATALHKTYPGGSITVVNARSVANLRQDSAGVLLADEIDSYRNTEEGDPIDLLLKRAEAVDDPVVVLASTPTKKGLSRIGALFARSDQRRWHVPCPHCHQRIVWTRHCLRWTPGDPRSATLHCPSCGGEHTEAQRVAAYHAGEWRPTNPHAAIGAPIGFHLDALCRPWRVRRGWPSQAAYLAALSEKAQAEGPEAMQVLMNTVWAEEYEEESEILDWQALHARREDYNPSDQLPDAVTTLTAGVDIQGDRIEAEIIGWGRGRESWGVSHAVMFGDTSLPSVWDQLDDFLSSPRWHPWLGELLPAWTCVDHGHRPDEVARFCRPRTTRHIVPVKGMPGQGRPLASPGSKVGTPKIRLYLAGVHTAKSIIHSNLRLTEPGHRYCHFPAEYPEEYFRQLTAEVLVRERNKRGLLEEVWKLKLGESRNEALDIRVYALAALALSRVDLEKKHRELERIIERQRSQPLPRPTGHPPAPGQLGGKPPPPNPAQRPRPPTPRPPRKPGGYVRGY